MIEGDKTTVLVVDDTPDNLTLINNLLRDRYRVKLANGGERALRICATDSKPDLILLDIMMPEIDGYEVCRRLKANPATMDIPVIFLTAKVQVEDEQLGFDVGAVDYITKPVSPPILLARVKTHLALAQARTFLRDQNCHLQHLVNERTRELEQLQDVVILAMSSLAETRDNDTGNHIRRTQHYVRALGRALAAHPDFAGQLDELSIELLFKSAPLHDIGKVGIPDAILLKPGRLSGDEFEIMKKHTTYGRDAIASAEKHLGIDNSFLRLAREIAYSHQEKWDGSGYPEGLSGEAIPLSARIMAIADVYDALISKRVYKPAFSHEEAIALIHKGRGNHFDPQLVDIFMEISDEFARIAQEFRDHHHDQ